MLDSMEQHLLLFYETTKWNYENSYGNLLSISRNCLDFVAPTTPLSFAIAKHVSSHLKSSISLGIPNTHHISFLSSSHTLNHEPSMYSVNSQLWSSISVASNLLANPSPPQHMPESEPSPFMRSWIVCGRLFSDNRLEAFWTHRLTPNTLSYVSAISNLRATSQLHCKLAYQTGNTGTELTFSSVRSLIGVRSIGHWRRTDNADQLFSFGGELYFTGTENSGGLSVGTRVRTKSHEGNRVSDLSMILNPMMGHLSAIYSVARLNRIILAARYDFNVFSFDSDLAVGLVYAPVDKNQLLKFRIGAQQGLGIVWEGTMNNMSISIGAMTELGSSSNPAKRIGCEILYTKE